MQHLIVELIPDPELGGFTARVPDIPAYGEGETEEDAIADLKDALATYIEEFGLDDATARLNAPSSLRHLDFELEDLTRA
jgi:predicted RNase H-like HicB family nuclease